MSNSFFFPHLPCGIESEVWVVKADMRCDSNASDSAIAYCDCEVLELIIGDRD